MRLLLYRRRMPCLIKTRFVQERSGFVVRQKKHIHQPYLDSSQAGVTDRNTAFGNEGKPFAFRLTLSAPSVKQSNPQS